MKLLPAAVLLLLCSCKQGSDKKHLLPSAQYHYVAADTAALATKAAVYVPVYSHIFGETGNRTVNLTATLSVRNCSFTDEFYLTQVLYYGSQGQLLKQYTDSAILLKPMHSVEFVVERSESEGGAGANFVVRWGSMSLPKSSPLMQAVMSETATGISFVTEGITIP